MSDPVCELIGVGKSFDGRAVIRDLDLVVEPGEMVAITGPSGSGKSTLLNMIGLLEKADQGEVRLFGERGLRVGSREATRLLRYRLGYLFQNFALVDSDSVDANLQIAQAYATGSRDDRSEARAAALHEVGLANTGGKKVYQLSGGEQQRVAIARLFLKPCDLVLADEPTGSLDAANADVVIQMLCDINARGKTVVVVTHDDRVAAMCRRTITLRDPRGAAA
jgi:putative ABC transport system ATP-binding protein